MATFFGEVLDVTNRAYNDAEDEIESTFDYQNPFVAVTTNEGDALVCDVLLVACDSLSKGCISSLYSLRVSGGSDRPLLSVRYREGEASLLSVYGSDSGSLYIAVCNGVPPTEDENWLAYTIMNAIQVRKHVVALTSSSLRTFCRSDTVDSDADDCQTALVRHISVAGIGKQLGPHSISPLNPPNMASGLSAALTLYCNSNSVPAILLCIYCAYRQYDTAVLQLVHSWLSQLSTPDLPQTPASSLSHVQDFIYT